MGVPRYGSELARSVHPPEKKLLNPHYLRRGIPVSVSTRPTLQPCGPCCGRLQVLSVLSSKALHRGQVDRTAQPATLVGTLIRTVITRSVHIFLVEVL